MLNGQTYCLLGLSPKQKQKQLIIGRARVDRSSFRVRRIEGKLSKSPSWLLKNVYVKLDFAERSGNSVQSAMEATADVRFIGTADSSGTDARLPAHEFGSGKHSWTGATDPAWFPSRVNVPYWEVVCFWPFENGLRDSAI